MRYIIFFTWHKAIGVSLLHGVPVNSYNVWFLFYHYTSCSIVFSDEYDIVFVPELGSYLGV